MTDCTFPSHPFESFHYLITFVKNALKTITYEKIPFLYFLHPPCGQSYATLPESLASIAQSAGNTNANTDVPEYLYNGKEKQAFETAATNYLDYGARFYNPVIIRWNTQDPMAEKYQRYSPYTYCVNDPIRFVDPNGEDWIINGSEDAKDKYLTMLYNATGNVYDIDDNNTLVLLSSDENFSGNRSKTLINTIQSGIDSDQTFSFSLAGERKDDPNTFIDNFTNKTLDLTDLSKIGEISNAFQGALIGHFLDELFTSGNSELENSYSIAHEHALNTEGVIYGELINDASITRRNTSYNMEYSYDLGSLVQVSYYIYNSNNIFRLEKKQKSSYDSKNKIRYINPTGILKSIEKTK